MESVYNEIFKALSYLFIAGVVSSAWKLARDNAKEGKLKAVLWKGLLWCAGIALFASIILGQPSCLEKSSDGCNYYADDGFEPNTEQRVARFAYFMTLLYIPVVFGVVSTRK